MDKELNWKIIKQKSRIEPIGQLNEALASNDKEEVQKILQDPELLRTLVVDRGEQDKNYDLLLDGFKMLIQEKFGAQNKIFDIENNKILQFIREYKLPDQILGELTDIAYHKRDTAMFFKLLNIIADNKKLIDNEIYNRAMHNLATWEASVAQDKSKSLKINQKVMRQAQTQGQEELALKAKFGVIHNRPLKIRNKAQNYDAIAKSMKDIGHDYDAINANIEAARAYFGLAKLQKEGEIYLQGEIASDNIDLARKLAFNALKEAETLSYPNAQIKACSTLAKIYKERGNKKLKDPKYARRYAQKAQELEKKYKYKTKEYL